jgi:hypothetical protein
MIPIDPLSEQGITVYLMGDSKSCMSDSPLSDHSGKLPINTRSIAWWTNDIQCLPAQAGSLVSTWRQNQAVGKASDKFLLQFTKCVKTLLGSKF